MDGAVRGGREANGSKWLTLHSHTCSDFRFMRAFMSPSPSVTALYSELAWYPHETTSRHHSDSCCARGDCWKHYTDVKEGKRARLYLYSWRVCGKLSWCKVMSSVTMTHSGDFKNTKWILVYSWQSGSGDSLSVPTHTGGIRAVPQRFMLLYMNRLKFTAVTKLGSGSFLFTSGCIF